MLPRPAPQVPARAPLSPPELDGGLYTLTQPHALDPVGWLWVSQSGALEDWVTTDNWQAPGSGNTTQAVTFTYIAASSTVTSVTELLEWIRDNYPNQCPNITDRYRHGVTHFAVVCPP